MSIARADYHEICAFPLRQPLRGFAAAALAVAGPQLGAQDSAEKGTGDHPSHDHQAFVIEPHERLRVFDRQTLARQPGIAFWRGVRFYSANR